LEILEIRAVDQGRGRKELQAEGEPDLKRERAAAAEYTRGFGAPPAPRQSSRDVEIPSGRQGRSVDYNSIPMATQCLSALYEQRYDKSRAVDLRWRGRSRPPRRQSCRRVCFRGETSAGNSAGAAGRIARAT